jgi:hypothetical protein
MGFFRSIFGIGRPAASPSHSSRMHSHLSTPASQQSVSPAGTRREMLRVVLRDTLNRHGIPAAWIVAEILSTTARDGERGLHWRLHIKHWDPRLLTHSVALQNALIRRVMTFDPLAEKWLTGISWQYELEDESGCPPLPHPTSWSAPVRKDAPPAAVVAGPAMGDVIAGPVHIEEVHEDLNQLLALRDEDFQKHAQGGGWASTEPAKLPEPRL